MVKTIDKNSIQNLLNVPRKVMVLDEVFSTNDYIKNSDFDVVIAKSQTGGKGTNNRKFFSPKGGVYLSIKLKNPKISADKISFITPFTAVIVASAIEKVSGVKPQIKWVNDLYINSKKLAGILCESVINNGSIDSVIIGVGINVDKQEFPVFELNEPTSIENETGKKIDKNLLISEILNAFDNVEKEISSKNFVSEYKNNFYLKDKQVKVIQNDITYQGIALGVDDNLHLLLKTDSEVLTFISATTVKTI